MKKNKQNIADKIK
jgi:hypothetical protein